MDCASVLSRRYWLRASTAHLSTLESVNRRRRCKARLGHGAVQSAQQRRTKRTLVVGNEPRFSVANLPVFPRNLAVLRVV